jgi:hypothetical protein
MNFPYRFDYYLNVAAIDIYQTDIEIDLSIGVPVNNYPTVKALARKPIQRRECLMSRFI